MPLCVFALPPPPLSPMPPMAGMPGMAREPFESFLPPRNPPGSATMLKQPRTFVLCRHFSIKGQCKSGAICKFAHGVQELDYWNTLAGRHRASPSDISYQMTINYTKTEESSRRFKNPNSPRNGPAQTQPPPYMQLPEPMDVAPPEPAAHAPTTQPPPQPLSPPPPAEPVPITPPAPL
mmetsp:Transcript_10155/g.35736  ORF Transcript_10155/g.35736 Transcript_10155/m.35736 type:complete len:178 (-) Transcript_10155:55-588(-)